MRINNISNQIFTYNKSEIKKRTEANNTIMPEQKIRPPMPWRCPAVSFISDRSRGLMTGMGRRMSCGFIEKS